MPVTTVENVAGKTFDYVIVGMSRLMYRSLHCLILRCFLEGGGVSTVSPTSGSVPSCG